MSFQSKETRQKLVLLNQLLLEYEGPQSFIKRTNIYIYIWLNDRCHCSSNIVTNEYQMNLEEKSHILYIKQLSEAFNFLYGAIQKI